MKTDNNTINKDSLELYLKCKDHTVSNEQFDLVMDSSLGMLLTLPKPTNKELGKYYESPDYISHTDSKKSIFDKVYQLVKTYAINGKVKLISKDKNFMLSEKFVLDVGCGTGDFLNACKNEGWTVTGIEPNKLAKNLSENKLGKKIFSDISEISTDKFDCITLWHVLEHVPDLEGYISKLKELLTKQGILIIAVPNYKSYDAAHYKEFWAAYDVPRHLWHFSQKSISLLFGKEKMNVIKTLPMKFDSFYVSLLSEKYKTGKSNPLKAFAIGLKSNFKAMKTKEYSSLIYLIKNE